MGKRTLVLATTAVLLLSLLFLPQLLAEDARIRDILVTNSDTQILLYARVTDCFTDKMEAAILAGVPTSFTFLIDLYQEQRHWFDKKLLRQTVGHTIKYDNVKKAFYVTTGDKKDPAVFQDFESAKRAMADLNGIPVVTLKSLPKGGSYYVQFKAKLDKVRLPFYMEYIFFFVALWDFETDWYREGFLY